MVVTIRRPRCGGFLVSVGFVDWHARTNSRPVSAGSSVADVGEFRSWQRSTQFVRGGIIAAGGGGVTAAPADSALVEERDSRSAGASPASGGR